VHFRRVSICYTGGSFKTVDVRIVIRLLQSLHLLRQEHFSSYGQVALYSGKLDQRGFHCSVKSIPS